MLYARRDNARSGTYHLGKGTDRPLPSYMSHPRECKGIDEGILRAGRSAPEFITPSTHRYLPDRTLEGCAVHRHYRAVKFPLDHPLTLRRLPSIMVNVDEEAHD